jgi:hypothetical protein
MAVPKLVNPHKVELNKLRAQRLQLVDSKNVIRGQVNCLNPESREERIKQIKEEINAVTMKIANIKALHGIR